MIGSGIDDEDVIPIRIVKEEVKKFPEHLDAYTFPSGMTDVRLESPKRSTLGTLDYFCLDAASLLPVVFLDVQENEEVFDICAGPGGKSMAIVQTLMPSRLLCNDADKSRLQRVKNAMESYLKTHTADKSAGLVEYTKLYGKGVENVIQSRFDKVLCDVMCTADRYSMNEDHGNWFSPSFKKLRLQLPSRQSELLESALKMVKPGGSVVYSTCTLSPAQNDGVVYNALRNIWSQTKLNFVVK